MSKPMPFDVSNPEDVKRLHRELLAYMKISVNDGTDRKGRQYTLDALNELVEEADIVDRIRRARADGKAIRAFREEIEGKEDWKVRFKRAATECAKPLGKIYQFPCETEGCGEAIIVAPSLEDIPEGGCHIVKLKYSKICVAKEKGKIKIFEIVEEE